MTGPRTSTETDSLDRDPKYGPQTQEDRDRVVALFAEELRVKLNSPRNRSKGSWCDATRLFLAQRLYDELRELDQAVNSVVVPEFDDSWARRVLDEAVDVAAFAAFINDPGRRVRP